MDFSIPQRHSELETSVVGRRTYVLVDRLAFVTKNRHISALDFRFSWFSIHWMVEPTSTAPFAIVLKKATL
jgi:hypothetical protein